MEKVKVGIIGCGNISGIYLKNGNAFDVLDIVACADLISDKAEERAKEFNIPRVMTVDELLADPEIEIVLNLTIPGAHAEVSLKALEAGKSVYVEKPLALTRAQGEKVLALAEEKGLLVGCAPDTFLGGGLQTCRKVIEDGWIGEPIGATAFMMGHGPEGWHPNPEFYYQHGGGPMFDMGPYYLTALVSLMGPVAQVSGATRITFPERTITSKAKYGQKIQVEVPTHVTGILEFATGAIGNIITSFDVWKSQLPRIEIYGTEGTLSVPDPNTFGGPVSIFKPANGEWEQIPLTHGFTENSRGLGLADMATALRTGREHRANGKMAYHVLDIMHGIHDAAEQGKRVEIKSDCTKPVPLNMKDEFVYQE